MIFLSSGFDAHTEETMAQLKFSEVDYAYLTRRLVDASEALCEGRLVSVLEGGYSLRSLARSVLVHLQTLSNAASLLAMPVIGAVADARAEKKKWLFAMTVLCIAATAGLAFAGPGTIVWASLMIVLSNLAYNVGETLNSAFLPEIAPESSLGKVSGWGWAFGYCGGLVTLGASLLVVTQGESFGLTFDQCVAGTMLITAFVFALASTPLFLWLKERSVPRVSATLALCGFLYQCGVSVVITLSAVYASAVMGFETADTIFMVFLVNITAAIGAFLFGYVQDAIGHKRALAITLLVWLAMIVVACLAETRGMFWAAANLAGLAMGSSRSAGRAMVGVLAPKARLAEFYSFWNMALWVAAIVGPLSYGAVTWMTGNDHRMAIAVTGLFFAAALLALMPLNLDRGRRAAEAAD